MDVEYMKLTSIYSFREKVKFRIANTILLRFNYCWADCVLWALGRMSFRELNKHTGCNYCGVCETRLLCKVGD